ncbi:hypothetical protein DFH06DRAFT_1322971 [Mycena polygramma]|nr:hypothetical protein DFH06DRAFT_1322971 [Mycena polygramma]
MDRGWTADRDYLRGVCNEFHARVDWRLADHEEPESPLPAYDPTKIIEAEILPDEEEQQKRARIAVLNRRIGRWLKYRVRRLRKQSRTRLDSTRDPWAVLLAKLSGLTTPPKARQAYQQFMHEEYEDKIHPEVVRRWAEEQSDGSSVQTKQSPTGPFRAKIARELFGKLTESERGEYGTRAKKEAAEKREAYDKALNDPPSKSPEARQKCIDNVGSFLAPILQGIYEFTGLHTVAIMGGVIPKFGELRTIYVTYGRNKTASPAHFPSWGKERFNGVLELMKEYLRTAFTEEDVADATLPDDVLAGAKYTMNDDDSASDSDEPDSDVSDSSDSETDSNVDSDDSDRPGKKSKKKRSKPKAQKKTAKADGADVTKGKKTAKAAGADAAKAKKAAKADADAAKGKSKKTSTPVRAGAKRKRGADDDEPSTTPVRGGAKRKRRADGDEEEEEEGNDDVDGNDPAFVPGGSPAGKKRKAGVAPSTGP